MSKSIVFLLISSFLLICQTSFAEDQVNSNLLEVSPDQTATHIDQSPIFNMFIQKEEGHAIKLAAKKICCKISDTTGVRYNWGTKKACDIVVGDVVDDSKCNK